MSVKKILEDDWTVFDEKKITDGTERNIFLCRDYWEVDFLKDLIKKHEPNMYDTSILQAIELCCRELRTPQPKEIFIKCVLRRLGVGEE